MTGIRATVLAGAALAASGLGAGAADLYGHGGRGSIKDGGYHVAPPRGCPSWYVRVDGAYASHDRPRVVEIGIDDWNRTKWDDTWTIGGGIGHYFTCNVRGDITVDYRFESDVKGDNTNPFTYVRGSRVFNVDSTVVLANIYYDFDMRSRFTPYIGIGLGAAHHDVSGRGIGYGTLANPVAAYPLTVNSSDRWSAAGAIMTGFSLALRERIALDAGYRFLYLGDVKSGAVHDRVTGASAGPAQVDNMHAHEFRLGVRVDVR